MIFYRKKYLRTKTQPRKKINNEKNSPIKKSARSRGKMKSPMKKELTQEKTHPKNELPQEKKVAQEKTHPRIKRSRPRRKAKSPKKKESVVDC
jgi:hypothetical protein